MPNGQLPFRTPVGSINLEDAPDIQEPDQPEEPQAPPSGGFKMPDYATPVGAKGPKAEEFKMPDYAAKVGSPEAEALTKKEKFKRAKEGVTAGASISHALQDPRGTVEQFKKDVSGAVSDFEQRHPYLTRYGKTVATDIPALISGFGKMLVTPPSQAGAEAGRDIGVALALGQPGQATAQAGEAVTGLPIRQVMADYAAKRWPELAGHMTTAGLAMLAFHELGGRKGTTERPVPIRPTGPRPPGPPGAPPIEPGFRPDPNVPRPYYPGDPRVDPNAPTRQIPPLVPHGPETTPALRPDPNVPGPYYPSAPVEDPNAPARVTPQPPPITAEPPIRREIPYRTPADVQRTMSDRDRMALAGVIQDATMPVVQKHRYVLDKLISPDVSPEEKTAAINDFAKDAKEAIREAPEATATTISPADIAKKLPPVAVTPTPEEERPTEAPRPFVNPFAALHPEERPPVPPAAPEAQVPSLEQLKAQYPNRDPREVAGTLQAARDAGIDPAQYPNLDDLAEAVVKAKPEAAPEAQIPPPPAGEPSAVRDERGNIVPPEQALDLAGTAERMAGFGETRPTFKEPPSAFERTAQAQGMGLRPGEEAAPTPERPVAPERPAVPAAEERPEFSDKDDTAIYNAGVDLVQKRGEQSQRIRNFRAVATKIMDKYDMTAEQARKNIDAYVKAVDAAPADNKPKFDDYMQSQMPPEEGPQAMRRSPYYRTSGYGAMSAERKAIQQRITEAYTRGDIESVIQHSQELQRLEGRLKFGGYPEPSRVSPEIEEEEEGPSFARKPGGGYVVSQNIKRSAKEVTTGYDRALPAIMVREAFQNAKDAVASLGAGGKIRFKDTGDGFTMEDNGTGMSEEELGTKLVDLFESGKATEAGATGGKGVGSASYLLGGKHVEVASVKFIGGKKIEASFSATPDELMSHFDINTREVPLHTPTGTKVDVKFTDEQMKKNAYGFDAPFEARGMYSDIMAHSRDLPTQASEGPYRPDDIGSIKSTANNDKTIGQTNIHGNDITVSMPKNPTLKKKETGIRIHVLNNGMYQYTKRFNFGKELNDVPDHAVVNVKPSADEGTEGYPFPTARESLKDYVQEPLDEYIRKVLVEPEAGKQQRYTQQLYDQMTQTAQGRDIRKHLVFDPGNRFTPAEMEVVRNSPIIKSINSFFDRIADRALNSLVADNPKRKAWADKLEGVGTMFSEAGYYGVHVPNPSSAADPKSSIMVNPFNWITENPHDPYQAAWDTVATLYHELGHIGKRELYTKQPTLRLKPIDEGDPNLGDFVRMYLEHVRHGEGQTDVFNTAHSADWLARTAEVMVADGPSKMSEAVDELTTILTDPARSGRYNAETQKILQLAQTRAGRPETTKDYLSPTGVKSEFAGGGKGTPPSRPKADRERTAPLGQTVNKLLDAMEEARSSRAETEESIRTERSQRFREFRKTATRVGGPKGAGLGLRKLAGEYEKPEPGARLGLDEGETKALFNAVSMNPALNDFEAARGVTAIFKLLNGDKVPTRSDLQVLDTAFGSGFADKVIDLHGGIGAIGLNLAKTVNTMKSLENAISLAAPLRHGAGLITHIDKFAPAFVDMFKFFSSQDRYTAGMEALKERPGYELANNAGVFFSDPTGVFRTEEEFVNSYAGRLGPLGTLVKASSRGYSGFLNKLRSDVFDKLVAVAEKNGEVMHTTDKDGQIIPTQKARTLANFVNVATGRGNLGALNKYTNEMNMFLWSPRMMASRVQMLTQVANPKFYMDMPKGTRLEGLRSLLGIAAMGLVVDGLSKAAGATVSNNILSSDFGKSRFGNKVLDPGAGFQQNIVAAARFLAGFHGDKKDPWYYNMGPRHATPLEIAGGFLKSKESPAASFAHEILSAKKFTGAGPLSSGYQPNIFGQKDWLGPTDPRARGSFIDQYGRQTSVQRELAERFLPIFVQDLGTLVQTDPQWSKHVGLTAVMGAGSLMGMTQNYPAARKPGAFQMRPMRQNLTLR